MDPLFLSILAGLCIFVIVYRVAPQAGNLILGIAFVVAFTWLLLSQV
jgi:hypothetical protein